MKKVFFFLICLLFIPVVFAKDNVSIEKIELVSKGENVIVNSEPTFSGLEMNYDIAYKKVGDAIKYKVTVRNYTNIDYKIASDTEFGASNYIKYEYEVNDILKANSSVDVLVTITYNKEIPDNKFVNDRYDEANVAVVKLLTMENKEVNPKTSANEIIMVLVCLSILSLIIAVYTYKNKKNVRKMIIVLMISMISIPFITRALEEIKLKVNVKVEILKTYKVAYHYVTKRYIKASQVAEYESKIWYCDGREFYEGSYDEENHYKKCLIDEEMEDPIRYYAGEKVNILPSTVDFLGEIREDVPYYDLGRFELICESNICPEGVKISKVDVYIWDYSKDHINHYGFTYQENDPEIMNFKLLEPTSDFNFVDLDNWPDGPDSSGYVNLGGKIQFTMPKHDVLFVKYPPAV